MNKWWRMNDDTNELRVTEWKRWGTFTQPINHFTSQHIQFLALILTVTRGLGIVLIPLPPWKYIFIFVFFFSIFYFCWSIAGVQCGWFLPLQQRDPVTHVHTSFSISFPRMVMTGYWIQCDITRPVVYPFYIPHWENILKGLKTYRNK